MEKINLNNQEDLQTSKPKITIKRDLPPLPPSKNLSRAQKDVDVVSSDSAVEKTTVDSGKGEKQKSKKGKHKKPADAQEESQVLGSEDRLQYEYLQQIAEEDAKALQKSKIKTDEESTVSQTMTLNNDVGKKKKKKLKTLPTQSDDGCVCFPVLLYKPYKAAFFEHYNVSFNLFWSNRERIENAEHSADADNENESKGKKKKKKKHREGMKSMKYLQILWLIFKTIIWISHFQ